MDNISGYKAMIEDIEQGLENKDQIEKGVLFTDGEKLRIPLTKEVVFNTIEMALKDYRANVARTPKARSINGKKLISWTSSKLKASTL